MFDAYPHPHTNAAAYLLFHGSTFAPAVAAQPNQTESGCVVLHCFALHSGKIFGAAAPFPSAAKERKKEGTMGAYFYVWSAALLEFQ